MGYALMAISMLGSAYSTYKQGQAQEAYYEAQAEQQKQKAAITAKQAEVAADNDAYEQKKRNDQMRIIRGQAAAAAGAANAQGTSGSYADLLNAAQSAYEEDTQRALFNQRQQQGQYAYQVNAYKNNAETYRVAAKNAIQQAKIGAIATIAGGMFNMYSNGAFGGASSNYTNQLDNALNKATKTIGSRLWP